MNDDFQNKGRLLAVDPLLSFPSEPQDDTRIGHLAKTLRDQWLSVRSPFPGSQVRLQSEVGVESHNALGRLLQVTDAGLECYD